jgi:hypothetical protein
MPPKSEMRSTSGWPLWDNQCECESTFEAIPRMLHVGLKYSDPLSTVRSTSALAVNDPCKILEE